MLIPTILLGIIAAVLVYVGWKNGQGQHIAGMRSGAIMTVTLIPLIFFALTIAGMVTEMMSPAVVGRWIGTESGLRGILIGTAAGAIAPGGPFVSLPIAVGLIKSGAGVGTMVAFLTGWALIAVSRLPMEFAILGWKLTLIRIACTFFFAPIAGLLAQFLFGGIKNLY